MEQRDVLTCTAHSGDGHTLILTAASIGAVHRHQTLGIGSGVLNTKFAGNRSPG
jgi:hypothetical protein